MVIRGTGKSRCPISLALEVVGDPWSLLVVRDIVYFGKQTFGEFSDSAERISPSVLANRLARLEAAGVLTRSSHPGDDRRVRYQLTERGLGLIPVLLELANWSAQTGWDTDAPPAWISLVNRDKARVTATIVAAVRRGGSIFVSPGSVAELLLPEVTGGGRATMGDCPDVHRADG